MPAWSTAELSHWLYRHVRRFHRRELFRKPWAEAAQSRLLAASDGVTNLVRQILVRCRMSEPGPKWRFAAPRSPRSVRFPPMAMLRWQVSRRCDKESWQRGCDHGRRSDWEAFVHLRSATIELAAFVRADGSSVPRDTAQHYALGMASDLI